MKIFQPPRWILVIGGLMLISLLAACAQTSAPVTSGQPASDGSNPSVEGETPLQIGGEPAAEAVVLPSPTSQPMPSKTVSTELAATDPRAVSYGAGRPALVEFFAFW
jgi:hypothetical protein